MSPKNGITDPATPASRRSSPLSSWRSLARIFCAISAVSILMIAASSWAQETSGATDGGAGFDSDSKDPLEISADNGIEWKRDARTYTARGNAIAKQGDTTIAGDTLIAYLDEQDEVTRWEAIGNVTIKTSQSTSYGDYAEYQESKRLLVLTGKNLKVDTESQTVTARDQIEDRVRLAPGHRP